MLCFLRSTIYQVININGQNVNQREYETSNQIYEVPIQAADLDVFVLELC